MRTTLRKVGNSRGVLIPAALLAECQIDGPVEMTVEAGRLVIAPVRSPREGWFDAAVAIAAQGEDADLLEGIPADEGSEEWVW